jgi:hypothetical protein
LGPRLDNLNKEVEICIKEDIPGKY